LDFGLGFQEGTRRIMMMMMMMKKFEKTKVDFFVVGLSEYYYVVVFGRGRKGTGKGHHVQRVLLLSETTKFLFLFFFKFIYLLTF
jgi:hypothetical protein